MRRAKKGGEESKKKGIKKVKNSGVDERRSTYCAALTWSILFIFFTPTDTKYNCQKNPIQVVREDKDERRERKIRGVERNRQEDCEGGQTLRTSSRAVSGSGTGDVYHE